MPNFPYFQVNSQQGNNAGNLVGKALLIPEDTSRETASTQSETGGGPSGEPGSGNLRFFHSLLWPFFFVVLLWFIRLADQAFSLDLYLYGIFPRKWSSLVGVLLAPLIHASHAHLLSNSLPLLVLGSALFYFYRVVALRVILLSVLITGFWVWVIGRPSFHVGASGLIYSLAAFLFASGFIRRHPRLMALSLLVAFLYGGLVWGIIPYRQGISWESHLMGLFCGVLLAWFFRIHGPQRKLYSWDMEEDGKEESDDPGIPMPDQRDSLSMSLCMSFSRVLSRLSKRFFPLAREISSLARPRSLM